MEWITKTRPKRSNYIGDVVISEYHGKRPCWIIRFANHSFKKITNNFHLVVGSQGTKLYFKGTEPRIGYKLSGAKPIEKQSTVFFKVDKKLIVNVVEGEYNLEFDDRLELWFIDFTNKIEFDGIDWKRKRYNR